ncbi:uncharacterized protein PHACADRAFT_261168 [Phanerochaete carnosa HHB-10118-sp]|uniref:ubiquitinyl hydrolase 1 n=1 Tax=Phanerochaete carnosa (strain HHB-10118-sp) TaxID=650164 RepID=K5WQI0_PHACS|nr:uncharacterized protein PHACADRAFT_261168 [Phanerochaete carnosa HHB-10118-sp]EKM52617.1 hypothetical protein PHACADRAFT_261168 [Phanerochaete carnosa HHB-10118-sp]
MKAGDLPDIDDKATPAPPQEGLPGYSIVAPGSELSTLPSAELFEMNQVAMQDAEQPPDIPLIGLLTKLSDLQEEYIRGNQTFVKQISRLVQQGYLGVRRTRGDGDCFYRAFAFAYIERLLKAPEPFRETLVQDTLTVLGRSVQLLQNVGYEALVYEDFYETLVHTIKRIINARPDVPKLTQRGLLDAFNDTPISNSIMIYMRYVTSAQIKVDPFSYAPYLYNPDEPYADEPMNPADFCNHFVECMGKEADHVQITALTTALKVNVRVAYLDGHEHGKGPTADPDTSPINFVSFDNGEGEELEAVTLLYRPGHYDVLSRMSEDPQESF